MLVGLHLVEIASLAHLEAIVTVELQKSSDNGIPARHTLNSGVRETRKLHGAIPEVRVVKGLLTIPGINNSRVARHERIALNNPHKLLHRVIEVELDLVGRRSNRFTASELKNLNEILMGHLGELATLISVKEYIVDIERGSRKTGSSNTVNNLGLVGPAEIAKIVELKVDANLVILKSNQRKSQTRIAAKPELKRDIESILRRTLGNDISLIGSIGSVDSAIRIAASSSIGVDQVSELRNIADHLGIDSLLTGLLSKLIPDMEPITVMFIAKC
jgi:hypothetical protein